MIVYADVLIIVNFIVDYFLILLTGRIVRQKPRLARCLASAAFGAFSTLIIFLPPLPDALEILINVVVCSVICLIAFGFVSVRRAALTAGVLLAVTFSYAGAMFALWSVFSPAGMVINNSVVYFDVSPLFLICFSAAGFIVFSVFSSLFARRHTGAKKCVVCLTFGGVTAEFSAVIDSGNALADPFSGSAVIIGDPGKCTRVFGELTPELYPERYRALPCGTVSGRDVLSGFRCDSGKITAGGTEKTLASPILALSKTPLCDCEAIVNPCDFD